MKLVLATRSSHKASEVRRILADAGAAGRTITLLTLDEAGIPWSEDEEGLEPHETFEENAASKARYFGRLARLPAVADDSGLEVDALGGRPGVRTKRFAPRGRYPGLARDDANNQFLLDALEGLPQSRRGARYVCVACLFDPASNRVVHFRGEAPGRILARRRGTGGFGYDPIFLDEEAARSYAELSAAEKDERSHRAKAFRALAAVLRA